MKIRAVALQFLFLSAAQPTDQGDESVVLLVVVIVVGKDHFSVSYVQFLGCEKAKTVS